NLTPFAVDWPPVVQTGRSEPILIVPLLPPPPPELPPQANATIKAIERTTSPLARTIGSPLCWLGGHAQNHTGRLPSLAALFPACGARVRRRGVRPHGVAELLLRAHYCLAGPPKSSRTWIHSQISVREVRAVVDGV